MMNIKQLALALTLAVAITTPAFAMDEKSIYDNADHAAGKTYYRLIEEAAEAKLDEENCTRVMNFVRKFPTKNLNNYDRSINYNYGEHPQYEEYLFFKSNVKTILEYEYSHDIPLTQKGLDQLNKVDNTFPRHGLAWHDLRYALEGIVKETSLQLVK